MINNIIKKILTELWIFIYVHLYATPIAIISFGFIIIMAIIIWILLNM